MKKALSIITGLSLILIFACAAHAKNFVLKHSSITTAKDPWGQSIIEAAKKIEKTTNGTVKLKLYMGGSLGAGNDVIRQVARGRIDMGGFTVQSAAGYVPELSVLQAPFLFDSAGERDCVLDNHIGPLLDEMFIKKGLKLLQYSYAGTNQLSSKKPIITPSDIKNVKFRASNGKHSIFFLKSVGAQAVPLPWSDTAAALQTGMVKGTEVSPPSYFFLGYVKLPPHYTLTSHIWNPGFYLINLRTWNKMSSSQQNAMVSSLEPAASFRKKIRGMEAYLIGKYQKEGGPVHRLTAEQKQQWKDMVQPHYGKLVDEVGGRSQEFWNLIQKGKVSCSK